MQKPFLPTLLALSLATALVGISPAHAAGDSADNGTGPANDNVETTDPNYGANGASMTGESDTAPNTAVPTEGTTRATSTGGDASLDSMWSDNSSSQSDSKSKSKKKGHDKSRSSSARKTKHPSDSTAGASISPDSVQTSTGGGAPTAGTANATTTTDSQAGWNNSGSVLDKPVSTTTQSPRKAGSNSSSASNYSSSSSASNNAASGATTALTSPSNNALERKAPAQAAGDQGMDVKAAAASAATDTVFSTGKMIAGEHTFPLCSTQSFFQSELIRSVSWPGVGPFRGDTDPNDLVDPQENKMTLQTSGDKLTAAELILLHQPGNPQGFINLEMVMDFMLEALGVRDKRINDFNGFLEKNKEILAKNKATEEKPLTTSYGPYTISIAGSGKNNESSYLIQVKSKRAIDEAARSSENSGDIGSQPPSVSNRNYDQQAEKPPVIASATTPTTSPTKPVKKPTDATREVKPTGTESGSKPTTTKPTPADATPPEDSSDSLKEELANTIRGWQAIKKEAVKTRDASELPKLLSGKALAKQNLAIGWLTKEKKYYELTPKSVTVSSYKEISQNPKRYAVFAEVKEVSRLLDEGTNKLNKEEEAQYKVNYTLEKTGDHFTIYDSQLIQQTGTTTGGQSKTTTPAKSKH